MEKESKMSRVKTVRLLTVILLGIWAMTVRAVAAKDWEFNPILLYAADSDLSIVATKVVGRSLKLEVSTARPLNELTVLERSSLVPGSWIPVTFSTNGIDGFLNTDLSRSVPENGNHVVYLPLANTADFYAIEHAPISNWFGVAATSDPAVTTHELSSGGFVLGISDKGGGYINKMVLPGIGNVMGLASARYGRGGQSSIRDDLHGGKYNPTQAGFSDVAGTVCRICMAQDGSALVVVPRPCCLFRGDGGFDFTEWENLASDGYTESGGSNDWDMIDESQLPGKQATEITSEFDYYCTYENRLGAFGSVFAGTNAITIPCFRHYFEYRYIRAPGHCLLQFNLGPLYDPVAGAVTDLSVVNPAGVQAATSNDMGVVTLSMSIRMDRALWTPGYIGCVNGSSISNLSFAVRGTNVNFLKVYQNATLASRATGYRLPNRTAVAVPLFILADSTGIDQGGALGLYYPDTAVNEFSVIGVNRDSGAIIYEDDRRMHLELRDEPTRTADMQWCGFRSNLLGLINPLAMETNQYEALRGEFYMLYGSPREIFENAQRIQPF